MDEDDIFIKYGHLLQNREFVKKLLRRICRDAEKEPRLKEALIEAGIPRRMPREKDYFFTAAPKRKRKQIH